MSSLNIDTIPHEIWIEIFAHLDIPDIHNCLFVCQFFYTIASDSYLTHTRLQRTADWLSKKIYQGRPSTHELYRQRVLVSPHLLSPECRPSYAELIMSLSLRMKKDAVQKQLSQRPTRPQLEKQGVIPPVSQTGRVASSCKKLERQRVADKIARFLDSDQRPSLELAIKRGVVDENEFQGPTNVRTLIRMFAYWSHVSPDSSSGSDTRRLAPQYYRHPSSSTSPGMVSNRSRASLYTNSGIKSNGHKSVYGDESHAPPRAKVKKMRQKFENCVNQQYQQIQQQTYPKKRPLIQQRTGITFGAVAALRQRFLQLAM